MSGVVIYAVKIIREIMHSRSGNVATTLELKRIKLIKTFDLLGW